MGLIHHVERDIETGTFAEMLDPDVPDWPMKEAMKFTKLALRCAELRRKDRPDLGSVMLPELKRLRELAEENIPNIMLGESTGSSPNHSQFSTVQVSFTRFQDFFFNWKGKKSACANFNFSEDAMFTNSIAYHRSHKYNHCKLCRSFISDLLSGCHDSKLPTIWMW